MGEFRFKQFAVADDHCGMKICTDSVLLGAWADPGPATRIADLGAGSGVLALMMAQRRPGAHIAAIEIDPLAAADAKANFTASLWAERLHILNADALAYEPAEPFDFIISNPPYFASELKSPDAQRAAARHGQGMGITEALAFAADWLAPGGGFAMVTPADRWQDILYEAELRRLRPARLCRVSSSPRKPPSRILWQFAKDPGEGYPACREELLSIRDGDGYSAAYVGLTKDFYLNF